MLYTAKQIELFSSNGYFIFDSFAALPHLPESLKRCYQEVTTYSGYFTPMGKTTVCDFVIWKADPTVCRVRLQVSASIYLSVPCMYNFIQLPNGEKMCASVTERSKSLQ